MQSPDFRQNYFELFGIAPTFDIDAQALQATQRRLQASCHPDRFANASSREKRLSVQTAAWVNQAFDTLRDPVRRSRYLLELEGAELPDEAATTSDSAFLMEQLELREALERCRDAADGLAQCEAIGATLAQRAAELEQAFVARFEAREFEAAAAISHKMQFIQRLQQQLAELRFDLEDA